jgi:tRNA(adenine34) deaminase
MRALDPDRNFMAVAIAEARAALAHEDVPIGCVIARGGEVLAASGNEREAAQDPTAHAEVLALRAAARAVGSWRLEGCTVYVTLEPCAMCAGALVLARVDRLVIGAMDPKAGAVGSVYDIARDERLNHRIEVVTGVRAEECGALLREFFAAKR